MFIPSPYPSFLLYIPHSLIHLFYYQSLLSAAFRLSVLSSQTFSRLLCTHFRIPIYLVMLIPSFFPSFSLYFFIHLVRHTFPCLLFSVFFVVNLFPALLTRFSLRVKLLRLFIQSFIHLFVIHSFPHLLSVLWSNIFPVYTLAFTYLITYSCLLLPLLLPTFIHLSFCLLFHSSSSLFSVIL